MQVKILKECGFEEAHIGLALSFYDHKIPLFQCDDGEYFWTLERFEKMQKVAIHIANKQVPEDYETRNNLAYISAEQKFLEQIDVWTFIQASRDFWSEFDTYRVDMSKQSSSTMHTLSKRNISKDDFEVGITELAILNLNSCIDDFNDNEHSAYRNISILKKNLPEGWLQERIVKTSYKTLKWILEQRDGHRLESWKIFNKEIYNQIEHPEFIKPIEN
jgi:hypothetical protein